MAKSRIYLELSTFESLKEMKVKMNKVSFDDVVQELIRLTFSRETVEKISNSDLLLDSAKNYKQMLKRLEALHDRFGYYEKNYFTKIIDIADDIEVSVLKKVNEENIKKEVGIIKNNLMNDNESDLQKMYDQLNISYEELRQKNKKNLQNMQNLKNKISKKSGVFTKGFDLNFTQEEYNSFFNLK